MLEEVAGLGLLSGNGREVNAIPVHPGPAHLVELFQAEIGELQAGSCEGVAEGFTQVQLAIDHLVKLPGELVHRQVTRPALVAQAHDALGKSLALRAQLAEGIVDDILDIGGPWRPGGLVGKHPEQEQQQVLPAAVEEWLDLVGQAVDDRVERLKRPATLVERRQGVFIPLEMGRKRNERRCRIVRLGADVEEVRELDAAGFDQREERLDDRD